jgi:cell division protein FtsZ
MGSAKEEGTNRAKTAIVKALDSPLLNDNKITGAKNVLLLIVSGTNEVTLDEIGEINDFIQEEAGYDANIIMGVGEDENLGDAIAVTIVATGFAADQQSTITNTEVKKIIHTLEDEQKATYNFSENTITKTPTLDEPTSTHDEDKIIHVLEDEVLEETSKMDLIPTTDLIKTMDIFYDEIEIGSDSDEDFVITDVSPVIAEVVEEEPTQLQADLLFDLPLNTPAEVPTETEIKFNLNEEEVLNINEINVFETQEIKAEAEKRYVLEDFEAQPTIGKSSKINKTTKVEEDEIQFELRTSSPQVEIDSIETI